MNTPGRSHRVIGAAPFWLIPAVAFFLGTHPLAARGEADAPVTYTFTNPQAETADRMAQEAKRAVEAMKANNGARENPDLYQDILIIEGRLRRALAEGEWEKTIELANEVGEKVDRLLLRLRRQANDDLLAVQADLRRLLDEGGETYAVFATQRVRDTVSQIQEKIAFPARDYLTAIALAQQAMLDAQKGLMEVKRRKCEAQIEILQRDLIRAQQLKAEYFVPELWNSCSNDFAKLVENFWKSEYDFVLAAADRLKSRVAGLLEETRLASARYQLQKLEERIARMRVEGTDQVLPRQFAALEKTHQEARARWKDKALDEVETICNSAFLMADTIEKSQPFITIETNLGTLVVKVVSGQDIVEKIRAAESGKVVIQSVREKKPEAAK